MSDKVSVCKYERYGVELTERYAPSYGGNIGCCRINGSFDNGHGVTFCFEAQSCGQVRRFHKVTGAQLKHPVHYHDYDGLHVHVWVSKKALCKTTGGSRRWFDTTETLMRESLNEPQKSGESWHTWENLRACLLHATGCWIENFEEA